MSKHKIFYGWYMVATSWLMSILVGAVSVAVFFKPMLEDFGWDRATLSSVQSVALIVFTIASPLLGRLIDRFGPRNMIFVSVVAQVFSNLLNGIATKIWQLYLARFFYGITPLSITPILINRWFIRKRGVALGIAATGMPLGTMILAPISQYLILQWGWRQTMLFWAAVTFVIMLPAAFVVKNNPKDKGTVPDGETLNQGIPNRSLDKWAITHKPETWINLSRAIRTRSFMLLSAAHFICGLGCGLMMTHIVIFATDLGYADMIATSLLSVMSASCLIGTFTMGWLSDRITRKNALALTHLIRSMSFLIIVCSILTAGPFLWMLYASMIFFGFGWFTTAPLTAGLVADLFGVREMGTILGAVTSCHMLGMAIGAYASGAIFEITGSYYLFFLIQGPLELLASFFVFFIKSEG